MDKKITVKEIARIIGVSSATVSNALNNTGRVSSKLRERILKTAESLDYKPNIAARAFVMDGINIGIVIPEQPEECMDQVMHGIKRAIDDYADYKVNGIFRTYDNIRETAVLSDILNDITKEDIQGLVFVPGLVVSSCDKALKRIHEVGIPIAYAAAHAGNVPGSNIYCPAAVMGRMAAEILSFKTAGKGKVGVITTSADFISHKNLIDAFLSECAVQKLAVADILENHDDRSETYVRAKQLAESHRDISAIYVTSFDTIPVCQCISDMGLTGNVSVLGHDVYPAMAEYVKSGRQFATIFQEPFLSGYLCVEALFGTIAGGRPLPERVLLKPQIVTKSNIDLYLSDACTLSPGNGIGLHTVDALNDFWYTKFAGGP